jgi:signal transduction histidine kinase
VLGAILSATVLAVVLFAIPLAVATQRMYRGERIAQLQRDAIRVATVVPDAAVDVQPAVVRPSGVAANLLIGIYRADGRRIAGVGPQTSALAAKARDGRFHDGVESGVLAVAVPVASDGGNVQVTVRVASASGGATNSVVVVWSAIAAAALIAIVVAAILARRQARAIAVPLERLTEATTALGAGAMPGPLPPSGILEADEAGRALERTAALLDATLRRQRTFSRDVSHQLRTPLTGLMLGLESALARPDADVRQAVTTAVSRLQEVQRIVEELLDLTEPAVTADVVDFAALCDAVRARWHGEHAGRGRRLDVRLDADLPEVHAPEAAVRQILDVLIDNALQHGEGTVSVAVRRLGDGVALDISDEGPGIRPDLADAVEAADSAADGRGLGLPLARSLADLAGGRLVVERSAPHPVLRLLLPAARTVGQSQDVSYR